MVEAKNIHSLQPRTVIDRYIDFTCNSYYPFSRFSGTVNLTVSPYEVETLKETISIINNNEKLVILQDGVFDFTNSFCNPFFTGKFRLLYPSTSNVIFSFGNKEKAYIKYFNPNSVVNSYMPSFISKTIKKKDTFSNENAKFDVMLTTANTAYFSAKEFDALLDFLSTSICVLSTSNTSYCTRIFDDNIIKALGERSLPLENNIINVDLVSALSQVKSVISTPSTLSVEVMILSIPIATILYRDYPLTTQTGWILYSANEVLSVVNSMVNYTNERMNIQCAILSNYIEADYPELRATDVVAVANKVPSIYDSLVDFSILELKSSWNFNLKYFFKRLICKIKK